MPDQPPSDRFKADMPQIPGVSSLGAPSPPRDSSLKLGIGLLLVLVVVFLGARWALHPRHTEPRVADQPQIEDRKSTRLNSSHSQISYAVFCLKKKKKSDNSIP